MDEYECLSHSKLECKYHVVFIPKCRARCRTEICACIRARCSEGWPKRRGALQMKGIFCPAMSA